MARVRLVLPEGIDDHQRPRDRRVNRFVPPLTQLALWLWQDGTVTRMDRLPDPDVDDMPDDVAGGGRDWRGEDTAWQVSVLTAAGYDFVPDVPGLTYNPQET